MPNPPVPRTPAGLAGSDDRAPAGFDAFWQETLAAHTPQEPPRFAPLATTLRELEVHDATFSGFGGHDIKGWLLRPRTASPRATVVQFLGNNTGRGIPEQWTLLPSAGYTAFVMDNRGQTGPDSVGATTDPVSATGPQVIGRMTAGIQDPADHYYRRLFTDAVCAIGALQSSDEVDTERLFVAGGSQGGATALATAALCTGVAGAIVDVPLLCDIPRAVDAATGGPLVEIQQYLRTQRGAEDAALRTLAFFDGVHFAARAQTPALFAVGLHDTICPPGSVQSAFAAYAAQDKTLCTYPYDGHTNGQWQQTRRHLEFLEEHCASR
ncbi:acetylxylan esterase [Brachybacterium endophyticum]|uniref:Acetylxylan esterase n=1 Tax=Brachybacterium endophyticum TaxID=2182385 RepID=A0A2U2RHC3_9MICO|nr:acetylxylan esterase [Brachybacterium endophyticum]PWH05272.1 acetylxylan esterase [Brachybacterium endophyticum]